jgi:hypothetical protein
MQLVLGRTAWSADDVRDDLRTYGVAHLGAPNAVLVVDETGLLKKGTKSVGGARQYSGTAGRVEHYQSGVFLGYATRYGRTFLDREWLSPIRVADRRRALRSGWCSSRGPLCDEAAPDAADEGAHARSGWCPGDGSPEMRSLGMTGGCAPGWRSDTWRMCSAALHSIASAQDKSVSGPLQSLGESQTPHGAGSVVGWAVKEHG